MHGLKKLKSASKKRSKKNWMWYLDVPRDDGHDRWKKTRRKTKTKYSQLENIEPRRGTLKT